MSVSVSLQFGVTSKFPFSNCIARGVQLIGKGNSCSQIGADLGPRAIHRQGPVNTDEAFSPLKKKSQAVCGLGRFQAPQQPGI